MPIRHDGKVEKNSNTFARLTLADNHEALCIYAVNLEYRLRNIETDRANLAMPAGSPHCGLLYAATLWHIDPQSGAVHSIISDQTVLLA
jgi:hypothetical protein